jgi:hypothetical protein
MLQGADNDLTCRRQADASHQPWSATASVMPDGLPIASRCPIPRFVNAQTRVFRERYRP